MRAVLRPVALVAASLVAIPTAAASGPPSAGPNVSLEWKAPAGCPQGSEVLQRTRALLSRADASQGLSARGVITQVDAQYVLELSTEHRDARGTRRLTAPRCESLAEPAALVLALAVDPDALSRTTVPANGSAVAALPPVESTTQIVDSTTQPPPAAALEPAPTVAPSEPRRVETKPADRDPRLDSTEPRRRMALTPRARVGLGAVADLGTLPGPALGATLRLGGEIERFQLELQGSWFARQSESVRADAGGDLALLAGGVTGCYRLLDAPEVSPCAGVEVARLSGEGTGVTDPGQGEAWLYAGALGARVSHPLGDRVALWARLDGLVFLNRPRFVLENVGAVHQPERVSGRGALGAEVRFP